MPSLAPSVGCVLSIGRTSTGAEEIHPRGGELVASAPSLRAAQRKRPLLFTVERWRRVDAELAGRLEPRPGESPAPPARGRRTVSAGRCGTSRRPSYLLFSIVALRTAARRPVLKRLARTTSFVRCSRPIARISEELGRERFVSRDRRGRTFTTSPHRRSTIVSDLQRGCYREVHGAA